MVTLIFLILLHSHFFKYYLKSKLTLALSFPLNFEFIYSAIYIVFSTYLFKIYLKLDMSINEPLHFPLELVPYSVFHNLVDDIMRLLRMKAFEQFLTFCLLPPRFTLSSNHRFCLQNI